MINFLKLKKYPWVLFAFLWLAAITLGLVGYARHAAAHGLQTTFFDHLYLTLQLIPMNSGAVDPPVPLELELARFSIPLLTAATAIKAFLDIFYAQFQMLRLGWMRNHIIICGLSRKGLLLTRSFRALGNEVVVIELDEDNDAIESCRDQGAVVLVGDATDAYLLERAGIRRARALFVVCDDDGVNAEIAIMGRDLVQANPTRKLTCLVHVTDPKLCSLLKENIDKLGEASFRMQLFNVYEEGARRMLQEYPAWEPERASQSQKPPHILIIGLGRMGENILIQAARSWRNPQKDPHRRLKVSIIDRNANRKAGSLTQHYPQLAAVCEMLPLQMEIASPEFEGGAFLFDEHKKPCLDAVYISVDDDSLGLHAGLTLLRLTPGLGPRVVVRMAEEKGLARLVSEKDHRLHAFGLLDHTCTPRLLEDSSYDLLARAAHEEYLRRHGSNPKTRPDSAVLRPWKELDEPYRENNRRLVDHLQAALQAAGYSIAPQVDWDPPSLVIPSVVIEQTAQRVHELWCQDKHSAGWRYAPQRDEDARTHPDLVSWEHLPEPEKEKNRAAVRSFPAIASQVGYQVLKEPSEEKAHLAGDRDPSPPKT